MNIHDLRQISHMTVYLGISVNIPTKAFSPHMCILFVCSESCFSTFGRVDWVGWRLTRGEDDGAYFIINTTFSSWRVRYSNKTEGGFIKMPLCSWKYEVFHTVTIYVIYPENNRQNGRRQGTSLGRVGRQVDSGWHHEINMWKSYGWSSPSPLPLWSCTTTPPPPLGEIWSRHVIPPYPTPTP